MNNQLAIVCPSAHLESYVATTFMSNPLVITALGTTFHTNNKESVNLLCETIQINNIDRITFVADINSEMIRQFLQGYSTEIVTVDRFYQFVFDQYQNEINETDSSYKQRHTFLEYLIKEQIRELRTALNEVKELKNHSITIDGYIVDRSADMKWSISTPVYSLA